MNGIAYFEIQATEPKVLVDFYTSVFDWKCELDPTIPMEYYRISTHGMMGAILKRPAPAPKMPAGTNAFTCSMQVSNYDETAEKIMAAGGIVAMEKFAIPGKCRQGYFVDPDSNVFGIFQVDEKAGM